MRLEERRDSYHDDKEALLKFKTQIQHFSYIRNVPQLPLLPQPALRHAFHSGTGEVRRGEWRQGPGAHGHQHGDRHLRVLQRMPAKPD